MLQGVTNNLRGFKGEMMALLEAPGVVAVCKKFRPAAAAAPQDNPLLSSDSSSSEGSDVDSPRAAAGSIPGAFQQAGSSSSCSSPRAPATQVEVDVVADEGLTWIEVKNQEIFGLASAHYVGGSHGKGLAEQVAHMLEVAALPEHKRRGRSPQVVVYFPSGVDIGVSAALTALGAKVASGPGSLAQQCGVVGNNVTNLDVTTLCGLVSEVSWRDPHCEALQAWAARTTHWQVKRDRAVTCVQEWSCRVQCRLCSLPVAAGCIFHIGLV